MAVECTGRNVQVTPALKNLARERTARLERHLGGPARVRVVLSHEKHRFGAEIIATHRRRRWNAHEYTADPRAAVALAFEKIDAQAMKDAERRRNRKRVSPRIAAAAAAPSPELALPESASTPRAPERRIVRTSRAGLKPLTVEEASARLESSGEPFVVYRDATTERVSILHRRRDGNFGLIEC